jgi:imidazole glycerol phosphate synthase subunit HisF
VQAVKIPVIGCGGIGTAADALEFRRVKDWRPWTFSTALGRVQVKVPRVVSCLHA